MFLYQQSVVHLFRVKQQYPTIHYLLIDKTKEHSTKALAATKDTYPCTEFLGALANRASG